MFMKLIVRVGMILGLLAVAGCGTPAVSVTQGGFFSPNPAARLYAIQQAGNQRDQTAITPLIELLNSDDSAERLLCITALERITGQRLGYNPYARPAEREKQIQAWVHAYQNGSLDTP